MSTRQLQKPAAKQFRKKNKNVFSDKKELARAYSKAVTGEAMIAFSVYDLPLLLRRTDGRNRDSYLTNRSVRVPEYNVDRLRMFMGGA